MWGDTINHGSTESNTIKGGDLSESTGGGGKKNNNNNDGYILNR